MRHTKKATTLAVALLYPCESVQIRGEKVLSAFPPPTSSTISATATIVHARFPSPRSLTFRVLRSKVKFNFAGREEAGLHVISKSAWRQAVVENRSLGSAIAEWHKIASAASWRNLMEVRKVYPSADLVGPYTVFNVKGNAYRLIVKIEYRWQMIFLKHLLTHAEYDRKEWSK
jgi:mRNA interferase HigB